MNGKLWGARVAIAIVMLFTFAGSLMAAEGARPGISFNHEQTRFSLTGMHTNVACESCHVKGVFKGTPTGCSDCHNRGAVANTQTKSATHIPTTQDCSVCHRTQGWSPATFSHANLTQSCGTCHNGIMQTGKPAFHLQTQKDCGDCHKTTAWLPAGMDHASLVPPATGRCSDCHGRTATGKPANHVYTTAQCDTCHNSTSAWLPATFIHPPNAAGRCNDCHTTSTATNKPANHIQTSQQCDTCHTTAGWLPTSFNHASLVPAAKDRCLDCHNGFQAKGTTSNHIPVIGKQCDICHTTGGWIPTSFAHTAGQTAGKACTDCHNGVNASGKKSTHISTVNYPFCDTCHTTTAWKPTVFAHQGVLANADCTTCHDGVNATGRPLTGVKAHLTTPMTLKTCGQCHTVGAAWAPTPMNHSGATSCTSCHMISSIGNVWTPGKAGHISTTGHAQCVDCHTTNAWKPSTFSHQGVTIGTDCTNSCHNVPGRQPPIAGTPTVTKVHAVAPMTSKTCGSCHSIGGVWGPGTKMNHAGVTTCSICHAYLGNDFTPAKVNHVVTSQQCSLCHTTAAWLPAYSHAGVTAASNCASAGCHSTPGQSVPIAGLPVTGSLAHTVAPMTSSSCGSCHAIGTNWGPGTKMNHTGVTNCTACHATAGNNWNIAKANHIAIGTNQCSACHVTAGWKPATNFDHAKVGVTAATNCTQSNCHSTPDKAVPQAGRPITGALAHLVAPLTSNTCGSCHTIGASWGPGTKMNHTGVTSCSSCHAYAGNGFTPAKANHINTALQCSTCHATTAWLPAYSHTGVTAASNCATAGCHNTAGQAAPVAGLPTGALAHTVAPMTSTSCGTCHGIGTSWGPGTKMNHSGVTNCTACHATTGTSWNAAKVGHISYAAGTQCSTCHATTAWLPAYSHVGVTATSTCTGAGCHSVANQAVPVAGLPTTGSKAHTVAPMNGTTCGSCHAIGTSWAITPPMNHAGLVTCTACHATTGTNWNIAKANHIPIGTNQCSSCHTTTAWKPATNFDHAKVGVTAATDCTQSNCHSTQDKAVPQAGRPITGALAHLTAPMTTGMCGTCHSIGAAWGPGTKMNHTGATTCSACHAYAGNGFTPAKAGHIVTAQQCSTCHTTTVWKPAYSHTGVTAASNCATAGCHNTPGQSVPVAGTPTGALAHSVAPLTSTSCGTCHAIGTSWGPGTKMSHTGVTNCSACHNWVGNGFTPAKANHVNSALQCSSCHLYPAWKPATYTHSGDTAATNCATAGCHNTPGQGVPVAGLPSAANLLHSVAPMNSTSCGTCHGIGTTWGPGTKMNHSGVTNCTACHATAGTNWNAAKLNHISYAAGTQCSTCHSTAAWLPAYSHSGVTATTNCATAGCHNVAGQAAPVAGPPTGALAHTVAPMTSTSCGSCHQIGTTWGPGTLLNHTGVTNCSACHAYAGNGFTPAKANHITTALQCSTCHNTSVWKPAYSHVGVTAASNCATAGCHNVTGQSVPVAGLPTGALAHTVAPMTSTSCGTCHQIGTLWGPGTKMNHTGVTNCTSCHATTGTSWNAAKTGHIAIGTSQCSACHTTAAWLPASSFNHAAYGVTTATNCTQAGCHDTANHATPRAGRPSTHTVSPMTANTCASCHQIGTIWGPGTKMNHTGATNCQGCHSYSANTNGWTVGAPKANHVVTAQQCSVCHTTTGWLPANSHVGVTAATNCATAGCHDTPGASSPRAGTPTAANLIHTVAPMTNTTCGTCHSIGGTWGPGTRMNHSGVTNCSGCHATTGTNWNTAKPGHIAIGSNQCSVCHTTAGWLPAYSHTGVTAASNCATAGCHSVPGQGVPIAGTPTAANLLHSVAPMTSTSCGTCHQIGTIWGPGTKMNHTGVTNCTACHATNGTNWNAAKPGHIAIGTSQCSSCHTTAAWLPATFNHAANGITAATTCTQAGCHDTPNAAVPKAGMPVTGALAHLLAPMTSTTCAICHTVGTSWGPGTKMNHTGVTNCSGCHAYTGNGFTPAYAGHVVTSQQCSACHTTTIWTAYNHSGVTALTNCATAGCHSVPGQAAPIAGTPTAANLVHTVAPMTSTSCGTCHQIGTIWGPGTRMNHTGVTNCTACHATTGTNWNTAKLNHISIGATQCSACHSTAAWLPASAFNHAANGITASTTCTQAGCHDTPNAAIPKAGMPITGVNAHLIAPMTSGTCALCHQIGSIWGPGTLMNHTGVTNCTACHAYTGNNFTPAKANHMTTALQCSSCHTTSAWLPASFNHQGVSSASTCNQSGCHNVPNAAPPKAGVPTTGALAHTQAPMTSATCGTCHAIGSIWGPGTLMNHTGLATCKQCHAYTGNGFTPAKANHIVTTSECNVCHTTGGWLPTNFAHTAAQVGTKTCKDCHNGSSAVGPSTSPHNHAGIAPTPYNCDACHRTTAWSPATFAHSGVTTGCANCHKNGFATAPSATHFITTQPCEKCHTTTVWAPIKTYVHISPYYKTHTGPVMNNYADCKLCHINNNEVITGAPHRGNAAYKPNCAWCHSQQFKAGSHIKTSSPTTVLYTVTELQDCGGACHIYTNNTFTTIKTNRTGHHRSTDGGF